MKRRGFFKTIFCGIVGFFAGWQAKQDKADIEDSLKALAENTSSNTTIYDMPISYYYSDDPYYVWTAGYAWSDGGPI